MTRNSKERIDHVAWVRRVNSRWIVRHGLNDSLADYLDYLAKKDEDRLVRSCRLAHRLVHTLEPAEDPKPWFYGGLFSLATEAEARRFLANHPLVASVVPSLPPKEPHGSTFLQSVSSETLSKINRLRETLGRMAKLSTA